MTVRQRSFTDLRLDQNFEKIASCMMLKVVGGRMEMILRPGEGRIHARKIFCGVLGEVDTFIHTYTHTNRFVWSSVNIHYQDESVQSDGSR